MAIKGIDVTAQRLQEAYGQLNTKAPEPTSSGFAQRLSELVSGVDELMDHSGQVQKQLVAGEAIDVHDVMIAGEEAGLAFNMMVEVRNKLVEAYQELMRMQV